MRQMMRVSSADGLGRGLHHAARSRKDGQARKWQIFKEKKLFLSRHEPSMRRSLVEDFPVGLKY